MYRIVVFLNVLKQLHPTRLQPTPAPLKLITSKKKRYNISETYSQKKVVLLNPVHVFSR